MNSIYLSIVIPAHNEAPRLAACVRRWMIALKLEGRPFEILIVENGSNDGTYDQARALAGQFDEVYAYTVPAEPRHGKGLAVRYGMTMARGQWRYMADVDLSTPPDEIRRFLRAAENGWPIIIGSRAVYGARVKTSLTRRLPGRIFAALTNLVLGLGIHDTQCGFKMFRGDVADDLFQRAVLFGWSFDVEVLYLARQHGYSIFEMPVRWVNSGHSHVHLVEDSIRMLRDVLQIRRMHRPCEVPEKVPA